MGADPKAIGDHVVGLLLQQAVEKATKALLSSRRVKYQFIHDIEKLFKALEDAKIQMPNEFKDLDILTPFVLMAKYESKSKVVFGASGRRELFELTAAYLKWAADVL